MQIIRFIGQNIKPIFYLSSLVISNLVLVKYLRQRKQLVERQNKILHKEIITLQQAVQILKSSVSMKPDKTYLIKAYPNPNRIEISIQKPVYSNQLYFVEPSLNKTASQIISMLNQMDLHKNDKNWQKSLEQMNLDYRRYWTAEFSHKFIKSTATIEYGEIIDHEIFDIKTDYKEMKDKGLIKTFLENLAYFFQFLFIDPHSNSSQKLRSFSENEDRAPFIKGPVIGSIRYLFNFIAGKPLLIEAKIQGNRIIPISLSSSKQKLLSSIDRKIFLFNFKIVECVVASFIAYKFLRPHLKKFIRSINKMLKVILQNNPMMPKRHQTFKMLQGQQIKDDLLCIICYTNCRNTVLFNCKHMIMCDECVDVYKNNSCPLCKAQILDEKKLVRE